MTTSRLNWVSHIFGLSLPPATTWPRAQHRGTFPSRRAPTCSVTSSGARAYPTPSIRPLAWTHAVSSFLSRGSLTGAPYSRGASRARSSIILPPRWWRFAHTTFDGHESTITTGQTRRRSTWSDIWHTLPCSFTSTLTSRSLCATSAITSPANTETQKLLCRN